MAIYKIYTIWDGKVYYLAWNTYESSYALDNKFYTYIFENGKVDDDNSFRRTTYTLEKAEKIIDRFSFDVQQSPYMKLYCGINKIYARDLKLKIAKFVFEEI